MKFIGFSAHRNIAGITAGFLLGGVALATAVAPASSAAPDCSAAGIAGTTSAVTGSARDYLTAHPGADQVVTAAYSQPRPEAEANIRGYFTANPQEYYELRGILAPLDDTQRTCNVTLLPPDLASALNEFMAG